MRGSNDWKRISVIIVAGVIGACQIGKAAIAVPLLQHDFGLSLFEVSWIVGAYALLGTVGGVAAAYVASHFVLHRVLAIGLGLIALGSFCGALSGDLIGLLISRFVEGIGFLAVVISGPTLLRDVVSREKQQIIFACWSAYIPAGTALMLLLGPILMNGNWRSLWLANAALAGLHAGIVAFVYSGTPRDASPHKDAASGGVREVLRAGGPLLLAFAFLLYAVQYYAMSNLLPTFFVDRMGLSLATAGLISAGVIMVNGLGNVSAGLILSLGVPVWCIVAVVFGTIGIGGFAIFSEASPAPVATAAAALCFGIAALLPASVIASLPSLSPTPRRLALSIGLVQQASSTGQAFGPAILAYWVQQTEWSGVPYLFAIIGLLGLLGAAALRRVLGRPS